MEGEPVHQVESECDSAGGSVTPEKPYKCELCGGCFKFRRYLQTHMQIHTSDQLCEYCGRNFNKHSNLVRHLRIHTGEKLFKCEHCSKCFTERRSLTIHIRSHTGEKPFKCEQCGKCFVNTRILNRHINHLHTGGKTSEADAESEPLNPGVITGGTNKFGEAENGSTIGEKPYKCEFCGGSFRLRRYLINHVRIHSQEKSFECRCCRKSFNKRSNLIRHVQKTFKCEECGICYFKDEDLTIHTRTHTSQHNDECDTHSKDSPITSDTDEETAMKIKVEPMEYDSEEDMRTGAEGVEETAAVFIKTEEEDLGVSEPVAVYIKTEEDSS